MMSMGRRKLSKISEARTPRSLFCAASFVTKRQWRSRNLSKLPADLKDEGTLVRRGYKVAFLKQGFKVQVRIKEYNCLGSLARGFH